MRAKAMQMNHILRLEADLGAGKVDQMPGSKNGPWILYPSLFLSAI